jgi:hypothetical protein
MVLIIMLTKLFITMTLLNMNNIFMEMKKIEVTMQEIWMMTKPSIHKNKKKYTRKTKHKKKNETT